MTEEPRRFLLSASPRCLHVEEAAAAFISRLYFTLDELAAEREDMISQNVSRSDPRFVDFEKEWAALLAVVDKMATANTKAWERLNSKPLTPAP